MQSLLGLRVGQGSANRELLLGPTLLWTRVARRARGDQGTNRPGFHGVWHGVCHGPASPQLGCFQPGSSLRQKPPNHTREVEQSGARGAVDCTLMPCTPPSYVRPHPEASLSKRWQHFGASGKGQEGPEMGPIWPCWSSVPPLHPKASYGRA